VNRRLTVHTLSSHPKFSVEFRGLRYLKKLDSNTGVLPQDTPHQLFFALGSFNFNELTNTIVRTGG
jgi:hypothetical protein